MYIFYLNCFEGPNPFDGLKKSLTVAGDQLQYYSLAGLNDARYGRYMYIATTFTGLFP